MRQTIRVLAFLILNIIVSAATTLLVISAWNRAHPVPADVTVPTSAVSVQTATPSINNALTPLPTSVTGTTPLSPSQAQVVIDSVLAPGDLANETVLLKSQGNGSLLMTNWRLQDDHGDVFTFPELTLNKDGAIQVHTSAGTNTVIDLYWGRDTPAWQHGQTVSLLDDQGKVRATYKIP